MQCARTDTSFRSACHATRNLEGKAEMCARISGRKTLWLRTSGTHSKNELSEERGRVTSVN